MRTGLAAIFISFVFAFAGGRSYATSAIDIGHNLTPTTKSMAAGQWTIGNYALAYGISDSIFIATSPWIWTNYNTKNIHLKWASSVEKFGYGLFASYFESLRWPFLGNDPYYWRNVTLQFLASFEWSAKIESFLGFRASYFWNDDRPYSIRMDSGDDAIRGQLDITSLTRIKIAETGFSVGLELGTIGANYLYPYLHAGASVAYIEGPWLLQGGFSYTIQWRELRESKGLRPGRVDSRTRRSPENGSLFYFPYETALHPEMQVQYFF